MEYPRFDFKNPNYAAVFRQRLQVLAEIRKEPECLPELKAFYRENPADFINDWGITFDPRNAERGIPTTIPFVLFPRQREWVDWLVKHWKTQTPGLTEKSRDMGISWLSMSLSCTLCLFHDGIAVGCGSRKEDLVDKIGTMKPLLPKARMFMENLPEEFRGGWTPWRDAPFMRINFPDTGSLITGEAGDQIGRGDRASIYLVDESAYLERPDLIEMSLSQTTNCRIDMSSVNTMNNPFAKKRHEGRVDVFIFDWHAQPIDARLVTPTGYRLMGDIRVGDRVIGSDGCPTEVIGVFPQGIKEVHRVSFHDGSSTESCADHLWSIIPSGNHRAERRHIRRIMPLREIMTDYIRFDERGSKIHRFQIPMSKPITGFDPRKLPIDPYVIGCLLGDGSIPAASATPIYLTTGDPEIADFVNERLPPACSLKHVRNIQYRISVCRSQIGVRGRGLRNPINSAMRALGLSGTQSHTKFIPDIYKTASPQARLEMLRGLMDTDGGIAKNSPGMARLSTTSSRLAADVAFVAQTLGGIAKIRTIKPGGLAVFGNRSYPRRQAYQVDVRLPDEMIPFKLSRKVQSFKPASIYKIRRSITGIKVVGDKPCQCITVAAEDGLYLTDHCIVTHNSDPRKDEAWYEKQCAELDPVTVAQEIDRDYSASVEGIVIPGAWVRSALGATEKLGLGPSGERGLALDVADEGVDKNAVCGNHGVEIDLVEDWSGKGADIFATTQRVFMICDERGYDGFRYDADGLGAGVRGDARIINQNRKASGARQITVEGFRGSDAVFNPDGIVDGTRGREGDRGRTNKDYFANRKAQGWWSLRQRFQRTHRWVQAVEESRKTGDPVAAGAACNPDEIISIDPKLPLCMKLVAELSQPTYSVNGVGKIVIDKKPDGMKSPNLADAVMIKFAMIERAPMKITSEILSQLMRSGRRRP